MLTKNLVELIGRLVGLVMVKNLSANFRYHKEAEKDRRGWRGAFPHCGHHWAANTELLRSFSGTW